MLDFEEQVNVLPYGTESAAQAILTTTFVGSLL